MIYDAPGPRYQDCSGQQDCIAQVCRIPPLHRHQSALLQQASECTKHVRLDDRVTVRLDNLMTPLQESMWQDERIAYLHTLPARRTPQSSTGFATHKLHNVVTPATLRDALNSPASSAMPEATPSGAVARAAEVKAVLVRVYTTSTTAIQMLLTMKPEQQKATIR